MFRNNKYSRRAINELLEKNANVINYVMTKETHNIEDGTISTQKIIQNEKGRKEEYLDTYYTRLYYDNFIINLNEKTYSKVVGHNVDEGKYIDITTKEVISWHILKNEFESFSHINSNAEYKYLKKELYNDKTCIIIELKITDTETEKIWIDSDTGLINKEEYYIENKLNKIIIYETELNNVTDNDLSIPNLKEFNFIEESEK